MSSLLREHVERLPTQRGHPGESRPPVGGRPRRRGELRLVRVGRHRHVLHAPRGHLLPVCNG